jgi:transcription elongation factor GreA
MTNTYILTEEGHKNMLVELEELKNTRRPKAVERLKKAREMGDLSENSEYVAAREDLSFIDGRIQEIEAILKDIQVIKANKNTSTIDIGSTIHVEVNGSKDTFMIVGEMEADLTQKKLSHQSPIGKALMGAKKGEKVSIEIPAGTVTYLILDIK